MLHLVYYIGFLWRTLKIHMLSAIEQSVGRVVVRYAGPAKKADHDDTVESIGSNEDGA